MWCCMRPSLSGRTACSDMDPRGTCFGCSVFVPPLSVWVSVLGGAARLEPPIGRTAARSRPLRTICWAPRANCLGKGRVDGSCACRWGCCQPAACGTSRCQWVGHLRPSWCRPLPLCRSTPRCSCLPLVRVPKRVWPVFFFFFCSRPTVAASGRPLPPPCPRRPVRRVRGPPQRAASGDGTPVHARPRFRIAPAAAARAAAGGRAHPGPCGRATPAGGPRRAARAVAQRRSAGAAWPRKNGGQDCPRVAGDPPAAGGVVGGSVWLPREDRFGG